MDQHLQLDSFFDLSKIRDSEFLPKHVFDLLGDQLKNWVIQQLKRRGVGNDPIIEGTVASSATISGPVLIEKGADVEPNAYIIGPSYISAGASVRHAAYIRGYTYVGPNAVVGHTTEVKGSCFLDGAKAGHFAYVGDSIIGCNANLGAGTKLANLKLNGRTVKFQFPHSKRIESSGLRKFGSIIGDDAQIGCNAVLSPGSLLLPKTMVMPCKHHHGTLHP